MLPLAHIGISILLASLLYIPVAGALIGSLAPDIVDKTLFVLGISPCSRFFAHSIFFGPLLASAVFIATRRKDIAIAVLFGSYVHLLEDAMNFLPLLYPLMKYNFYCPPLTVEPSMVDIAIECFGALLIPVTLALTPRIEYFRRFATSAFTKKSKVDGEKNE